MRSIETLVRTYPTKTGLEILEIQEQDILKDTEQIEKQNKNKLSLINDINLNGGYYKGRFGLDQYFYYKFMNLRLEGEIIYCDVEKIVCFNRDILIIEKRVKEWEDISNYGIGLYDRITESEYNSLTEYLFGIFPKFWGSKKD